MSVYVFVGPSVPTTEVRALLPEAFVLPPVAMGGVTRVVPERPELIAIIDGLFHSRPAVFHKEILHALAEGIPVVGAASMGALRAAELEPFGMRGVGEIFRAFRCGDLEDDDEVAVAHAEADAGFAPCSDAMVNIRFGLRAAVREQRVERSTATTLNEIAKQWFYPERSWRRLFATARVSGLEIDELEAWWHERLPDQKREDALLLLRGIARGEHRERPTSNFRFQETSYWAQARAAAWPIDGSRESGIPNHSLAAHALVFANADRRLHRELLYDHLVLEEARRRGVGVSTDEIEGELRARGWQVTPETRRLTETELLTRKLARSLAESTVHGLLPAALERRGQRREVVARVGAIWRTLARVGLDPRELDLHGVNLDTLMSWYRVRCPAAEPSFESVRRELGLDTSELLTTLLGAYLAERDGY